MHIHSRILATAGHVDHGKSALVKALSGIDPDRLPEEKARGITIDLGFAHLMIDATGKDGAPVQFQVGIVDVPGHEDFVKNMVAGVGAIDVALLVVAADDGWMPQTQEHLEILLYLGVTRSVVAMTKIDLVSAGKQVQLEEEIRARLKPTRFADAEIIPTSVVVGRGLNSLKQCIARTLLDAPAPRDVGKPRLAVDRAFVLRGVGTVVTGTLAGGSLSRGQSVVIQPAGFASKIRSMQTHNREIERAYPGMRVAINLPDVSVTQSDGSAGKPQVGRGDVVTIEGLGAPTQRIDVLFFRGDQIEPGKASGRSIRNGTRVWLHYGSANVPARIAFYGHGDLPPALIGIAQLRLEQPAFLLASDCFIVRDWPGRQTLGGGCVLDPAAAQSSLRAAERMEFVDSLHKAGEDCQAWILAMLGGNSCIDRSRLSVHAHFGEEQLRSALEALSCKGAIGQIGSFIFKKDWWQTCLAEAISIIDGAHRDHPQHAGAELAKLRSGMKPQIRSQDAMFNALIVELTKYGFVQRGSVAGRAFHQPALPPHLQKAGEKIRAALRAKPLDPPSRKELAPDAIAFQALKFLLQTGQAVDIGPDVILSAQAYADAVHRIRNHIQTNGPATVSELKQILSTSRRIMVPLLEKLDREGITVRQGDQRILKAVTISGTGAPPVK